MRNIFATMAFATVVSVASAGTYSVTGTPYVMSGASLTGNFTCSYINNNTFNYAGGASALAKPSGPTSAYNTAGCQAYIVWPIKWTGTTSEPVPINVTAFVTVKGTSFTEASTQSFYTPSSHSASAQIDDLGLNNCYSLSQSANGTEQVAVIYGFDTYHDFTALNPIATGGGMLTPQTPVGTVATSTGIVFYPINVSTIAQATSSGNRLRPGQIASAGANVNMNVKLVNIAGQVIP